MDEKGREFLKLLFNEGESICVSNNEFGFHSIPIEQVLSNDVTLISPNEKVDPTKCDNSDLIFVAINPIDGFRRDENARVLRSFMWEIDIGTREEQLVYFKKIGIPLSARVWSGGKSVHAITVLDEPIVNKEGLPDDKMYRYLYKWALNILTMCDDKCKNPSRSIRIPGAYRDNGKKQRLIGQSNRIKLKDFVDWLNKYEHLKPKVREKKEIPEGEADFDRLSPWARGMLKYGMDFKNGRNQTWFGLAVDFALAGFSEEETIQELSKKFEEEYDFKEKEWLTSIASAFKYVQEGKNR